MPQLNEKELSQRALSAYFRAESRTDGAGQPTEAISTEVTESDGLVYVLLANTAGIVAVYRVRIVGGAPVLKRLKRWPKALGAVA